MIKSLYLIMALTPLVLGCKTLSQNPSIVYLIEIEKGDTLAKIAQKYDTSWKQIAKMNDISDPRELEIGDVLRVIPGPGGVIIGDKASKPAKVSAKKRKKGLFFGGGDKTSARLTWPLRGRVTSKFGWRWGRMHEGIDIGGNYGQGIHSAGKGKVVFAGWQSGYGKTVIVKHGSVNTLYAHLSRINAAVGQRVSKGERIGNMGRSGNARGTHLHFEIRDEGSPVDPMKFIKQQQYLSSYDSFFNAQQLFAMNVFLKLRNPSDFIN